MVDLLLHSGPSTVASPVRRRWGSHGLPLFALMWTLQFAGERDGFFMRADSVTAKETADLVVYPDWEGIDLTGYDIEVATHIADRLGVELEILRFADSFNEVCELVADGDADIGISKLTVTMARAQYVAFSEPYVKLRLGVVINRLREVSQKVEGGVYALINRPGAKLGVQKGTSWVSYGRDLFPEAELVEYPDLPSTIKAVVEGEVLATLNDEWNIILAMIEDPERSLRTRVAYIPDVETQLAIAVAPGATHLLSFINRMIQVDGMRTTPATLIDRYFEKGSASRAASALERASRKDAVIGEGIHHIAVFGGIALLLLVVLIYLARGEKPHIRDGEGER